MTGKRALPFSGFHQLLDLALHEIAFERADVTDVELAIEMIGFVKECAREQFFTGLLEELAFRVLSADGDLFRASHVLAEIRNAEAAFTLGVLAFGANDFGI